MDSRNRPGALDIGSYRLNTYRTEGYEDVIFSLDSEREMAICKKIVRRLADERIHHYSFSSHGSLVLYVPEAVSSDIFTMLEREALGQLLDG